MPVRVRYETIEFGEIDIHVRGLRDTQEFMDVDGVAADLGISSAVWPLFGIVWPSGRALARVMVDVDIGDRRVLEVGCGLGLASLLLNHQEVDITATDRHPEAEAFLRHNVELNGDDEIPFFRTNWDEDDGAATAEMGRFDLIIGSDLLYEDDHVDSLAGFIGRHAKEHAEVILLDPRRGRAGRFQKAMVQLGFTCSERPVADGPEDEPTYAGRVLGFRR